jgi:hypothetical protein
MTAMKVKKYDSATMIPKGRLAGELVFGLGLGVAIGRRGKTKLTMAPSQSVGSKHVAIPSRAVR